MDHFERILCTRELQNSINESVYKTLVDIINQYQLPYFEIYKDSIVNTLTGSEFMFKGLHQHIDEIKSMKGITKCWCEEAHGLKKESLDILIPTIREPNSEIIFTFNRREELDPVYEKFCIKVNDDTWFLNTTYRDNPFFPEVLKKEMEKDKVQRPNEYLHIWEGEPRRDGGAMYDTDWFLWTDIIPREEDYAYRFIVADTAYKEKELENSNDPDYHVFAYFGYFNKKLYLIDYIRAQINAVDVENWAEPFIRPKLGYGFRYNWIEAKGHGIYLNQHFPTIGLPVPPDEQLKEMLTRKFTKTERASNSIAMIDRINRNVIINTGMGDTKIRAIKDELVFFPNGRHDDIEDCLCDAIKIAFSGTDYVSEYEQMMR